MILLSFSFLHKILTWHLFNLRMSRHDTSNIPACFYVKTYLKYNHPKSFCTKGTILLKPKVKGSFLFLLVSLLLLFFFYPFFHRSAAGTIVLDIVFLVILLTSIFLISERRNVFVISLILALAAFGSTVLNYFLLNVSLQLAAVSVY